jgi:hypothetical protein
MGCNKNLVLLIILSEFLNIYQFKYLILNDFVFLLYHTPSKTQKLNLQRILRAVSDTFQAEDTLCPIFTFSGIVGHIHIHGSDLSAFAAGDALSLITFNPQP